jgi:hypothetical protein
VSILWEFLLPAALGIALVGLYAPMMLAQSLAADYALRLFLGTPAGIGIASVIHLLLLQVNGARAGMLVLIELLMLLTVVLVTVFRKRCAVTKLSDSILCANHWPILNCILAIGFVITCCHSVMVFHATSLAAPHGEWDAWAVWNMRARFLYSEHWRDAWSVTWAHIDYPLLLPSWIAHGWTRLGNETTALPAATAGVFTFASIGLLIVAVGIFRSVSNGLLAGLFLLGCTRFTYTGTIQYADVPFAFFFLASLVTLSMQDRFGEMQPSLLALAGLFAGMAAWTKNEGQATMLAIVVALLVVCWRQAGTQRSFAVISWFLAGATPFIALIIALRVALGGGGNWLQAQSSMTVPERLLDFSRYQLIIEAFQTKNFTGFYGGIASLIMLLYGFIVGVRVERQKLFPWVGIVALALVIGMVFVVYLITPFDLEWHLTTSISRIVCQWLPSILFVYFLLLDTPEELQRAQSAFAPK